MQSSVIKLEKKSSVFKCGCPVFLSIQGSESKNIGVHGNDLRKANKIVETSEKAPENAFSIGANLIND